jgi:uncharacterized membrane protein
MESRAKLFGHSIHQTLVAFPVGLLGASVLFDIISLVGGSQGIAVAAYWMLAAGIVGGLLAAPFGLIDLTAVPPGTRASRIGRLHGIGNVIVLCLFIASWLLRPGAIQAPGPLPFTLSIFGFAIALMTAWMGGELVSRLGVGVLEEAHPNAPSSLDASARMPPRRGAGNQTAPEAAVAQPNNDDGYGTVRQVRRHDAAHR